MPCFMTARALTHACILRLRFCTALEAACVDCVDDGKMTKDLAGCIHGLKNVKDGMYLHTEDFMEAVEEDMKKKFSKL